MLLFIDVFAGALAVEVWLDDTWLLRRESSLAGFATAAIGGGTGALTGTGVGWDPGVGAATGGVFSGAATGGVAAGGAGSSGVSSTTTGAGASGTAGEGDVIGGTGSAGRATTLVTGIGSDGRAIHEAITKHTLIDTTVMPRMAMSRVVTGRSSDIRDLARRWCTG